MKRRNCDDEKQNEEIGQAITWGIVAGTILFCSIVICVLIIKCIN